MSDNQRGGGRGGGRGNGRGGSRGGNHHRPRSQNNHHQQAPAYQNPNPGKENTTRRLMVHQTDPASAASILQAKRFHPSQRWDQIGSIYFAETAPETDNKAQRKGTYLMADVYLGRVRGQETDFDSVPENVTSIRNEKGKYKEGREYIIKDPERALNIRYLDGVKPPNIQIEMRDRMPLIYATTVQKAGEIIKNQKIPSENRQNIAGQGFYLWENIPDAKRFSLTGAETFLAADVHFPYCFEGNNNLPNKHDYENYKSFRGNYQDTHYYMVKNPHYIEHIHYISGVRP